MGRLLSLPKKERKMNPQRLDPQRIFSPVAERLEDRLLLAAVASINDIVVNENAGNAELTVSLSEPAASTVTVWYSTANVTALATADYTSRLSQTVVFAPGETSKSIFIPIADDTLYEGTEQFAVNITKATNATLTAVLADRKGVVTVIDNEQAVVNISSLTAKINEHVAVGARFQVTRQSAARDPLTVLLSYSGTATAGEDFVAVSSVTIPAGVLSAYVTIMPINDTQLECLEEIVVSIAPGDYIIGSRSSASTQLGEDERATVSVVASDATAGENPADPGVFTLTRTGPATDSITVAYILNGGAVNGVDYSRKATTVTFAPGESEVNVRIDPIDDALLEGNEKVALTISAGATYWVGTNKAELVIIDNERPVVTVAAVNATEAGVQGKFTITRSGGTSSALTVNLNIGGTATSGADYQAIESSVVIPAGVLSKIITVVPIQDDLLEGPEQVTLSIAESDDYWLGAVSSAAVTIADDEKPIVSITASDADAAENPADNGVFTFTRTGPAADSLTVRYTMSGSALNGTDYNLLSGSVTFDPGVSSVDVALVPKDDALLENAEKAIATLTAGTTFWLGAKSAEITIADNERPVVTVAAVDATEAGVQGKFTITRSGGTSSALTVNLNIGGTATSGADYQAIESSVVIPAGVLSKIITVVPIQDDLLEGPEQVTLSIAESDDYWLGAVSSAAVTIADDEKPIVSITASDADAAENPADNGVFTFTRTGPAADSLTVRYTMSGSALNGTDYNLLSGSVTFDPGVSSVDVALVPKDDALLENAEKAIATLTAGTTFWLGAKSAEITIADDERPIVTIAPATTAASEAGVSRSFTLTRVGNLNQSITVNLAITGSATNGVDYSTIPSTVTIAAGKTTALVEVAPIQDSLVEGNEDVVVSIAPGDAYFAGAADSATITIADDEISLAALQPAAGAQMYYTNGVSITTVLGPVLNGVQTTAVHTVVPGKVDQTEYISTDGSGVWLHRLTVQTSDGLLVMDYPPLQLMPDAGQVNAVYTANRQTQAFIQGEPGVWSYNHYWSNVKVLGFETVTAAGQSFPCVKLQTYVYFNDNGGTISETTTTLWLAPNVGTVKASVTVKEDVTTDTGASVIKNYAYSYTLTSYTLP
jgi:hypothetical protein